MVRNFGRGIVILLLFAAGCEDASMNLLPPPPPAAAGTAGTAMAGKAGHTPGGDGGTGGTAASGGMGGSFAGGAGGSGGFAGTGGIQCSPQAGYPSDTRCCRSEDDCTPDDPFCSYGRCVACTSQPKRGCASNETCIDDITGSHCIKNCSTDSDCIKRDMTRPHCDLESNECVCTSDNDCKNSRLKHCQPQYGYCVECTTSDDCADKGHPICNPIWNRCVECTSSSDCMDPGRKVCSLSDQLPNVCVECTRNEDKACEDKGLVCNELITRCVECVGSQDCEDPDAPICRPDGRCDGCMSDDDCWPFGPCEAGRCTGRSQDPPPPQP